MDFSFQLEGATMTGNITPEMMDSLTNVFGAFIGGLAMARISITIAITTIMIISRWKLFKKAGLPGRGILIPVYNRVLIFKLGGMSGRRAISILFPPVFAIAMIVNYFKIAKKFKKHRAFGLGLLLVTIVFVPILAFDNSKRGEKKEKTIAKPIVKAATTKTPSKKVIKKAPIKKTPTKKPIKKVKTLQRKK